MKETSIVYKVEHSVRDMLETGGTVESYGSRLTLPIERKFGRVQDIQSYVDTILSYGPIVDKFGKIPSVEVKRRRGFKAAHYKLGKIYIPDETDWALRELVILHECAHHIEKCTHYYMSDHGPQFRSIMRDLVKEIIGPEVSWLLEVGWQEAGLTL